MANFTKYIILFLVLVSFVGVMEVESADAGEAGGQTDLFWASRKVLDPPTDQVDLTPLEFAIIFKKELTARLSGRFCHETCYLFGCSYSKAFDHCSCVNHNCELNELPPDAAASAVAAAESE